MSTAIWARWAVAAALLASLLALLCLQTGCSTSSLTPVDWFWENPVPTGQAIYDFWGTDSDDVFAVGREGTIFHYDGAQWEQQTIAPRVRLDRFDPASAHAG